MCFFVFGQGEKTLELKFLHRILFTEEGVPLGWVILLMGPWNPVNGDHQLSIR